MNPKLNKIFDKLKKGDKIKLKTSSTRFERISDNQNMRYKVELTTKHFHMCGSAQKVMKKHAEKKGNTCMGDYLHP